MRLVLAALIGLISGVASGALGIGGAVLSTPGIRWLGAPGLVAVGTTLPVIIPTALAGLVAYVRAGMVDTRLAVVSASAGAVCAVAGAYATRFVGGEALMLATAAVIFVLALRMLPCKRQAVHPVARRRGAGAFALVGAASGFLSGLLGIGGGVVLVPAFTVLFGVPVKTALGTSLAVVAAQAIPGTVVHAALGHIDWTFAAGLAIGVVPGARIGSRFAVRANDEHLRTVVALLLAALALAFGISELVR